MLMFRAYTKGGGSGKDRELPKSQNHRTIKLKKMEILVE